MKILLINNHSLDNAGDYAILIETLRVLERAFPGAQIGLSFNDVASAQAALPGYPIYQAPLGWFLRLNGQRGYDLLPRWQRLLLLAAVLLAALVCRLGLPLPGWLPGQRQLGLLRAYAEADLVLACGGGYLYAPGPHEGIAGVFNLTLLGCLLAALIDRPLVLLPQSIGPLHDQQQRRAVQLVLRHARLTIVRERQSLRLLEQLGCAGRALLAPDLAFGMDSAQGDEAARLLARWLPSDPAPAFLAGMTALNWSGQSYSFDRQAQYEAALLGGIDAITAQGGVVVLFPQCTGPSNAEDDRLVSTRLYKQARDPQRVVLLDEPLEPGLLQAAYGHMDYFIGTRMHSVILALNAGVPALAIGYLHKTSGMLEVLGLEARCLDIATISAAQLVDAFAALRAHPDQPAVAPFLARSRRFKAALPPLLQAALERHG
ncbi:MAG: polysaccharide pyruvyl transferase family protein [Roseiflexaceae bacterium]